ncbi:hypothetical protein [Caballeronia sp. SEWSISQ10-4 2]|nr:hypothetical protein [Caballeronia sp. SEWSISQ10-4 2]
MDMVSADTGVKQVCANTPGKPFCDRLTLFMRGDELDGVLR